MSDAATITRRAFALLAAAAAARPAIAPVHAQTATPAPAATPAADELPDTVSCDAASLPLTPPQTMGPYFVPGAPERTDLREPGVPGDPLLLRGYVLAPDCTPLADVTIEFWQADGAGEYDNSPDGFTLRGRQSTDAAGRYRLETVLPGRYPGRPPHIHVMLQPASGEPLVTQVYFPGNEDNERDRFFQPELLAEVEAPEEPGGETVARFDFVLPAPATA